MAGADLPRGRPSDGPALKIGSGFVGNEGRSGRQNERVFGNVRVGKGRPLPRSGIPPAKPARFVARVSRVATRAFERPADLRAAQGRVRADSLARPRRVSFAGALRAPVRGAIEETAQAGLGRPQSVGITLPRQRLFAEGGFELACKPPKLRKERLRLPPVDSGDEPETPVADPTESPCSARSAQYASIRESAPG